MGEPIRNRYTEAENRFYYMQEFVKSLHRIDEAIQSWQKKSNDRYSHLEKNEIEKVYKILTEKQKWYEQTANRFNTLRLHEDPPVLCSQIQQEKEVSKPLPK